VIRVVPDTSVLVSALLSRAGAPARILERWSEGAFDVTVCPQLIAELERALGYEKLRPYVSAEDANDYVRSIVQSSVVVEDPGNVRRAVRDPDDDFLVALARAVGAHALISGDRDLLVLELPDLHVLSPRAFLERLDATSSSG
jgi:putative PIN family toxin of toxin-antitoxin system